MFSRNIGLMNFGRNISETKIPYVLLPGSTYAFNLQTETFENFGTAIGLNQNVIKDNYVYFIDGSNIMRYDSITKTSSTLISGNPTNYNRTNCNSVFIVGNYLFTTVKHNSTNIVAFQIINLTTNSNSISVCPHSKTAWSGSSMTSFISYNVNIGKHQFTHGRSSFIIFEIELKSDGTVDWGTSANSPEYSTGRVTSVYPTLILNKEMERESFCFIRTNGANDFMTNIRIFGDSTNIDYSMGDFASNYFVRGMCKNSFEDGFFYGSQTASSNRAFYRLRRNNNATENITALNSLTFSSYNSPRLFCYNEFLYVFSTNRLVKYNTLTNSIVLNKTGTYPSIDGIEPIFIEI